MATTEAFTVIKRRAFERERDRRAATTTLDDMADKVATKETVKRLKDQTGLDPANKQDHKKLRERDEPAPPAGFTRGQLAGDLACMVDAMANRIEADLRTQNVTQMKLAGRMGMPMMDWILKYGKAFRDLYRSNEQVKLAADAAELTEDDLTLIVQLLEPRAIPPPSL